MNLFYKVALITYEIEKDKFYATYFTDYVKSL